MTCPRCGRPLAPGASCCAANEPADAWTGPPTEGYTVPLLGAARPIAPMRPLRIPAIVASAAAVASVLITTTSAALTLAGEDLGTRTDPAGPAALLLVLSFPILIVASISTVTWLYRALFNVHLLPDAHPRWSSGWAIAGWFIPLANLVLVPLVAADAARNTVPPQDHSKRRLLTALVVVWWVGYLGSSAVSVVGGLPQFSTAAPGLRWFSVFLRVVGAVMLILLMLWVTRLQEARFALGVEARPPVIPAMPVPVPAAPAVHDWPATPSLKAPGAPALRSAFPPDDR